MIHFESCLMHHYFVEKLLVKLMWHVEAAVTNVM